MLYVHKKKKEDKRWWSSSRAKKTCDKKARFPSLCMYVYFYIKIKSKVKSKIKIYTKIFERDSAKKIEQLFFIYVFFFF